MWQQWANMILGLWVVAIPFLGIAGSALVWTLVVSGLAVAILGLWGGLYEQSEEHQRELKRA